MTKYLVDELEELREWLDGNPDAPSGYAGIAQRALEFVKHPLQAEPREESPCPSRTDGLHDFRHEVCDCGASRDDSRLDPEALRILGGAPACEHAAKGLCEHSRREGISDGIGMVKYIRCCDCGQEFPDQPARN